MKDVSYLSMCLKNERHLIYGLISIEIKFKLIGCNANGKKCTKKNEFDNSFIFMDLVFFSRFWTDNYQYVQCPFKYSYVKLDLKIVLYFFSLYGNALIVRFRNDLIFESVMHWKKPQLIVKFYSIIVIGLLGFILNF